MADITANVVVSMPSQLFTASRAFKALAGGKIYIGKIDTDPTIPSNQVQVYVSNENGSQIPVPQPLLINQAGYPVYGGQIAKFMTIEGHSMAVLDMDGVQQFYFPNVLKYDPDQFKDNLAAKDGASLIGTQQDGTVQDFINKVKSNDGASIIKADDGRTVEEWLLAVDASEYRQKNISKTVSFNFKVRTKKDLKIVCQGDSMTAGYDVNSTDITQPDMGDSSTHATMTYPAALQGLLTSITGSSVQVTKYATSGQTAAWGYSQWSTNPNCDLAIIMYGINDANQGLSIDSYLASMEKLIRRYIDWGHAVIIMTCASGGFGYDNPLYQVYSQQAKNLATIYGCRYLDAHEVQYNAQLGITQSDSIHFNSIGYYRLASALAFMICAGGLMEDYRPITTENVIWPGKQTSSVGFFDPQKSIQMSYGAALNLQGIVARVPPNTVSRVYYCFYLDAEAAEVYVNGRWEDQQVQLDFDSPIPAVTLVRPPYYDMTNEDTLLAYGPDMKKTNRRYLRERSGHVLDGKPRYAGCIVGRGWHCLTFFTDQTNGAASEYFIQNICINPVSSSFAQGNIDPSKFIRNTRESYVLKTPGTGLSTTTIPSPAAIGNVDMPLPVSMYGYTYNHPVDSVTIELTITAAGGDYADTPLIFKYMLTRNTPDNLLKVTKVFSTNQALNLSRAYIKTAGRATVYAKGSQGNANMPFVDIYGEGDRAAGIFISPYRKYLALEFTGGLNSYWTVEVSGPTIGQQGAIGMTS